MANYPISCLYNPAVGQDLPFGIRRTSHPGRAVVVGAGPAGLEAALTLDEMGHRVFLFEKEPEIGGQVRLACRAPGKSDFEEIIRYYSQVLHRSSVTAYLSTEATVSRIKDLNPDRVILATGSTAVDLTALGIEIDESPILSISEALTRPELTGKRVLVLGGGNSGCEVADYLSSLGRQVTIMEMGNRIARDLGPARRYLLMRRLRENGVKNLIRSRLKSLTRTQVSFLREEKDGHRHLHTIESFDSYINALGVKSHDRLAAALKNEGLPVLRAGDALNPGKILDAVTEGARAARDFDQKLTLHNKNT